MSSNPQINPENQEIDLSQISKKIGNFFEAFSTRVFKGILFIKKNILVLSLLVILGGIAGFYLDKNNKQYDHQIIVSPNFGSADYLYSKIDLLNSKIKDGDTVFLKNIGFKKIRKIINIEIDPIIDIYRFIENSPQNLELIKLLAEDGDLNKIVKDNLTSKNYPYHSIKINTSKVFSENDLSIPLLKYLNTSDYFQIIQKQYLSNINIKIKENDSLIKQIDSFLDSFKDKTNGSKSSNLVYYNENSQLNDIIKTKDALINEQATHRLELITFEKIIKDISVVSNIKKIDSFNGKLKFILPILFLLFYFMLILAKRFYKNQLLKQKNT